MNSSGCRSPRRSLRASTPRFSQALHVWDENQVRTFECHVDGYPRPDIRWEKAGKPIGKSRRVHMTRCGEKCLLQIRMPQIEDMGVYTCIATNIVGSATTQCKVGASGVQKMNAACSQRLSPPDKTGERSRSTERSSELLSEHKNQQRSVFRIRSQSGSQKSRQESSKSKISNLANHLWKKNEESEEVHKIDSSKQKREILIDISKKQLSKSMDDCRRNKRSFLNRVKIPDIFNAQKPEAEPMKDAVSESEKQNGENCANAEIRIRVQNSKNHFKTKALSDAEKTNVSDAKLTRSVVDDSPIQLSTRDRIAAYLKRFENPPRTAKTREPPQEIKEMKAKEVPQEKVRVLKRNISNEQQSVPETDCKTENDNSLSIFNKFRRRKSSDSGKKRSSEDIRTENVSLVAENKLNQEHQNNSINHLTQNENSEHIQEDISNTMIKIPQNGTANKILDDDLEPTDTNVQDTENRSSSEIEQVLKQNTSNEKKPALKTEQKESEGGFFNFSRFIRRKSSDCSKKSKPEEEGLENKNSNFLDSQTNLTSLENISLENVSIGETVDVNGGSLPNLDKACESPQEILKDGIGNEKKSDGITEHKSAGNSSFFSFSKFIRRKSSDSSKKISNEENLVENCLSNSNQEQNLIEKMDIDYESNTTNFPHDSVLGMSGALDVKISNDSETSPSEIFLKCKPVVSIDKDKESSEVKDHPSSPNSPCDLDLGAFEPIDINILDTLSDYERSTGNLPETDSTKESSTDSPTTVSQTPAEGDDNPKEACIPLIHVEQSADNDEDDETVDDLEDIVIPSESVENHVNERSSAPPLNLRKPFKGKIKYSSPVIEEECELLQNEQSEILTLKTDLQRISSQEESPARIVKGPQSVTVLRGESVTLAICFSGHPPPSVTWMKGGRVLSDEGSRLSILEGREMSVVTVNDVTADDSGKYVVSVENQGGGDSCFASVAVVGFPEPPGGEPSVSDVTDHSLVLSWYGSMYDGGSVVTGYQVEMCTLPDKKWHKVSSSVNTSCSVPGLSKGQRYIFRVRAENRYGSSHPSKESKIIRLDDFLQDDSSADEEPGEELSAPISIESGSTFTERFDLKEEVGKGRFGTVYRCVDRSCSRPRAAKVIRCLKVKDKEKVRQEIEIMSRLHHPKLMQVLAAFESGRNMIMVMEYISGGELFERVIADDFVLTELDCILFMRQICDGVAYMHKNNVLHLDLKPENILCKTRTSHKIKIIDFGLARIYKQDESLRILFGTPEFVAPEVINYEPVCPASDMWSVGVICYVLLSGLSPFMGDNDTETFANITRGEMDFDDEAFDEISDDAKNFISSLLVKNVRNRLSADQCLKHPWLATAGLSQKRPLSTEKLKRFIIRRSGKNLERRSEPLDEWCPYLALL
ncbi:myosin light chain kinase, smooth muscle [Trichonephila inaurata madagascariensis]|uniref:Myosin light chain kinase, smooth muscle n=1 Tax=Trichonephila inaurata madagascariensis TaxID=2747483 RepID=A0A8X6XWF0_9ARAC|nr:myosin light chain kinase, smooth muscle [Trichonephila inaurata madagascariensis]